MKEIQKAEQHLKDIEKKLEKDNLFGYIDGHDFSVIMQDLLIPDGDYVIDTGNWENVNYACAYRLIKRIKKTSVDMEIIFYNLVMNCVFHRRN